MYVYIYIHIEINIYICIYVHTNLSSIKHVWSKGNLSLEHPYIHILTIAPRRQDPCSRPPRKKSKIKRWTSESKRNPLMDQKFVSWWCLPILWKYLYIIRLSFVWIHVSGMEKQFLCCLYKTGVISASISSWYLFCLLLRQWILLTALIAWRLLPDGDLFHTATSIPNWTAGWFIQWMSPSSCQNLLYHQQNITEIIRLTVCTCQKNLWRQREGERERERVFVRKLSDLTFVCWFMSLNMRRNSESRKKNTNIYISINTLGVVTRLNSFKNTDWTPEKV